MTQGIWYRGRSKADLASAVRQIREEAGVDQATAAERVSSSRSTISRIERGHDVSLHTALSIIAELGYEIVLIPRGSGVTVKNDR